MQHSRPSCTPESICAGGNCSACQAQIARDTSFCKTAVIFCTLQLLVEGALFTCYVLSAIERARRDTSESNGTLSIDSARAHFVNSLFV